TGKADGLDERMRDQSFTNLAVATLNEAEYALGHTSLGNGGLNGVSHDFTSSRMRGVAFHDHRATCGECSCRIATGGRESKWEVGCTEDGNRADWALHQTDFRTRRRLAVGLGFIHATVEIISLANMAGKKTQLTGGAAALTFKATCRQAGFLRAYFGDSGSARFDFVGNGFEEQGTLFPACIAIS